MNETQKLQNIFKALSDNVTPLMDGLTMKKITPFQGHDECLYNQGHLYYNNKRVAFLSDDAWCGPLNFDFTDKAVEQKIQDFVHQGKFSVPVGNGKFLDVDLEFYLTTLLSNFDLILRHNKNKTKTFIFDTEKRTIVYYKVPFTKETEKWITEKLEDNQVILHFTYRD